MIWSGGEELQGLHDEAMRLAEARTCGSRLEESFCASAALRIMPFEL